MFPTKTNKMVIDKAKKFLLTTLVLISKMKIIGPEAVSKVLFITLRILHPIQPNCSCLQTSFLLILHT